MDKKYTVENLPKKFEFQYDLDSRTVYTWESGKYSHYDCGHKYEYPINAQRMVELLSLNYTLTKNLDEKVPEEPQLVFPFTFTYQNGSMLYTAHYTSVNGLLHITWEGDSSDGYTTSHAKQYIKDGTWIVKSVGAGDTITGWGTCSFGGAGDTLKMGSSNADFQGIIYSGSAKTTPTQPLTIKVDSSDIEAATIAMKNLAQAVESVNISLESMQELMREVGNGMRPTGVMVEAVQDYRGDAYV